jgi:hypothetical protein
MGTVFPIQQLRLLTDQGMQCTPVHEATPGVDGAQVDYNNPKKLEQSLRGVHTLLSFLVIQGDPRSMAQKISSMLPCEPV